MTPLTVEQREQAADQGIVGLALAWNQAPDRWGNRLRDACMAREAMTDASNIPICGDGGFGPASVLGEVESARRRIDAGELTPQRAELIDALELGSQDIGPRMAAITLAALLIHDIETEDREVRRHGE